MASIERDLLECCNYLDSSKLTERRKRIEELCSYMTNDSVVHLLHSNSTKADRQLVWDFVFQAAHNALLKEGDKMHTEQEQGKVTALCENALKRCSSVLTTIAQKANHGVCRLSCRKLIESICQVLEDNIYRKLFGDVYLNILLHSVVPSKQYVGEIDSSDWLSLLLLSRGMYKEANTEELKSSLFEVYKFVLRHGLRSSKILSKTKFLFKLVTKALETGDFKRSSSHFHRSLFQLILTMFNELSIDRNSDLQELGEQIIPHIININDKRVEFDERKEAMLKLCEAILSIKYPCCVVTVNPSSSAFMKHCLSLYIMLLSEVRRTSRARYKDKVIPSIVLRLAARLAKLVFPVYKDSVDIDVTVDCTMYESFSGNAKRQKLSLGFYSILDNSSLHNLSETWVWFNLFSSIVGYYPELMGKDEFFNCLQFIAEKLGKTSDTYAVKYLMACAVEMLKVEQILYTNSDCESEISALWSSIWETTLRAVGLNHEAHSCHHLVQCLIPKQEPERLNSLYEMYFKGSIHLSESSLRTIITLNKFVSLSENLMYRNSLLKWLFSDTVLEKSASLVAQVLLMLVIKTKWFSDLASPPTKNFVYSDKEKFYLSSTFQWVPSTDDSKPLVQENVPVTVVGYEIMFDDVLSELTNHCDRFLSETNLDTGLTTFGLVLLHFSHLCSTNNLSLSSRVINIGCTVVKSLVKLLPTSSIGNQPNMIGLIQKIPQISNSISNVGPELIKKILQLIEPKEKSGPMSDDEDNDILGPPIDPVMAVTTIIRLSELPGIDSLRVNTTVELLKFLIKKFTSKCCKQFNVCTQVLKELLCLQYFPDPVLNEMLFLLQDLCKKWYMFCDETIVIFGLLKELVPVIYKSNSTQYSGNYSAFMKGFSRFISNGRLGKEVVLNYIKLIGKIIEVDDKNIWYLQLEGRQVLYSFYLLEFLNSPFSEIRMATIEFVPLLFRQTSADSVTLQSNLFQQLCASIKKTFIVPEGELTEDQLRNRYYSALSCYAAVASSSLHHRKRALYNIIDLAKTKNISENFFLKVLNYTGVKMGLSDVNLLIEQNLEFILWTWYSENHNFEDFPFQILNCSDRKEFYEKCKRILIPVCLVNSDFQTFEQVCERLESSKKLILHECFPEVMSCIIPKLDNQTTYSEVVKMHEVVQEVLGNELKEMLSLKLDLVLFQIFSKINSTESLKQFCGSVPNAFALEVHEPSYSVATVLNTLKYLQDTSPSPQVPLLVFLALELPDHLKNLIFFLYRKIHNSTTYELRLCSFLQYVTLADSLVSLIDSLQKMSVYIIMQIIHSLLHLSVTDLAPFSLTFLHRFISRCLLKNSDVIGNLLDFIFPILIPISRKSDFDGEAALKLLDLLKQSDLCWSPVLSLSDDLQLSGLVNHPDDDDLKTVVINFLETVKRCSDNLSNLQALQYLDSQLLRKKDELTSMYDKLNSIRGFSEDCKESLIHQLIVCLLKLTASKDQKVREQSGKCLGLLGPKELKTFVLQEEDSFASVSISSLLIDVLYPLSFNSDPEVILSSTVSLQTLLYTKQGSEAKEELTGLQKDYLFGLPRIPKSPRSLKLNVDLDVMNQALENISPQESNISHQKWITDLCSAVLDCFPCVTFTCLIPVIQKKPDVAERILPHLLCIVENADLVSSTVSNLRLKMADFFRNHYIISKMGNNKDGSVFVNKSSVQVMLSTIDLIRQRSPNNLFQDNHINLLEVASAAQFCHAHFTSILYAELWCDLIMRSILDCGLRVFGFSQIDYLNDYKREDSILLQNLLFESYRNLGATDATFGCGTNHLSHPIERIKYYKFIGDWQKVIEECELNPGPQTNKDLVCALRNSGLYSLAMKASLKSTEYECAWRLGEWSLEPPMTGNDFDGCIYNALNARCIKSKESAAIAVSRARDIALDQSAYSSLQVANNIYENLRHFQQLREIEDLEIWCSKPSARDGYMMRWQDCEPLMSQRSILLAHLGEPEPTAEFLLEYARLARKNNSFNIANRCLSSLEKLKVSDDLKDKATFEMAKLNWSFGNKYRSRFLLKPLLVELKWKQSCHLTKALLTYGNWMAESKEENPKIIIENYFKVAAEVSKTDEDRLMAAESLSRYADNEYQSLRKLIKSSEFNEKKESAEKRTKTGQLMMKLGKAQSNPELHQAARQHKATADIDKTEVTATLALRDTFLMLAMKEYIYCLKEGDDPLKMFHIVSLWEGNTENSDLLSMMEEFLDSIPSYKFLIVLPQIIVRLSDENSRFNQIVASIVRRCCIDHPHHGLPLLLALSNSHKDKEHLAKQDTNSKGNNVSTNPEPRVRGAQLLQNQLSRTNRNLNPIIKQMETLYQAYISLANYFLPRDKQKGAVKIPDSEVLRKIKHFDLVYSPTISVPVDKSGTYNNVIGIQEFEAIFSLVGGINQPKRVVCVCSDGISRIHLVKGKDDLRQDALLQQVFLILNTLLSTESDSSSGKLLIRTYKVVPMSQRSGVIEWCENTEPMSYYLIGNNKSEKGAHRLYRPRDKTPQECRELMMKDYQQGAPPKTKITTFKKICDNLQPVFRYYFYEKFPSPGVWFERRLAYTLSVAISSMIGYILGLGDRHIQNILIDKSTAEVIHIDFGIAFELGRVWGTPELVPFRLTRDMVDGMGVSGTEGVFRRCCEKTMAVLRKYQEPIITALEVLLYDPVYIWTLSKVKNESSEINSDQLSNYQDSFSSDEKNLLADRAVQRLRAKFQGIEDGSPTSVEGQVSKLIQEAKDLNNLALMFHGWQPYL